MRQPLYVHRPSWGRRLPLAALFTSLTALASAAARADEPPAPGPAVAAPSATLPAPAPETIDVTVRALGEADVRRRSAEAVAVVETRSARRQTADLGEVLARSSGVAVQRASGLGSDTRLSLNGLTDDQIRFFVDGVPLELAGFAYGIANVPVNLVARAEVFRGVVPIRFGADALGGAVNLVSEGGYGPQRTTASLQAGSFGTYRLTGSAQRLHEPSGWFTRASAFLDRADNDYPMTTDVADATGQQVRSRVYRFHDAYRAVGGSVESGVIDRPWAERLLLRAFVADYYKELQNSPLMEYVYGEATRGELTAGATLRYEHTFQLVSLTALAGYTFDDIAFRDEGTCVYDWFGRCVRKRGQPGEMLGRAQNQALWTHNVFARLNAALRLTPQHSLRVSLAPTGTFRSGDERALPPTATRDPLEAQRDLYGLVTGVEYEQALFGERLENVLFVKDYLQVLRSNEALSTGILRRRDRTTHRVGLGDSLRLTFTDWAYGKVSYEWATRLPRTDEVFGNGFPVLPNLELKPELSHNVNLELDLSSAGSVVGVFHGNVNGFVREVDQLIVLVARDQTALYQNVFSARSLGVEATADWTSPGRYLVLAGNATYVDFRNTSSEGAFALNDGDRVPNRPWLFANGSADMLLRDVVAPRDELSLSWATRYVHSFFRGWEGLGARDTKQEVPAQVVHSLALIYATKRASRLLTFTAEAQNLTDREVYDFFGVPRPGRAFHFKTTASL